MPPSSQEGFRQAQAKYTNATQAELRKDYDRAFSLYLEVAQSFLHISRTSDGDEKLGTRAKTEAKRALERAEKIKAATRRRAGSIAASDGALELAPVSKDAYSEQEQLVVLSRSTTVNGVVFHPWTRTSGPAADLDGQPEMSPEQLAAAATWRRPHDVLPKVSLAPSSLLPHDLLQESVADCSVCASIVVCLNHHRRFDSLLGLSAIHQRGQGSKGLPQISDDGLYEFRFLLNGTHRRIRIDDQLPFSSDNKLFCMHNVNGTLDLWPALMEKAYMKMMGGYEFSGSNSSIDIRVMTGWIPEHVEMHRAGFEQQRTWERLKAAFAAGACVLTAGTHTREEQLQQGTVLLPRHDYPIIDVQETNGDPWITILDTLPQGESRQNVVNVGWHEIYTVFDSLFVNWDPRLFKYHLDLHSSWRAPNEQRPSSHQTFRLAFTSEGRAGDLWVLLTRHTVSKDRTAEFIHLQVDTAEERQTEYPEGAAVEGAYTDSPHQLVRLKVLPDMGSVALFVSYDGPHDDVRFTVDVYSSAPLGWIKSDRRPPFTKSVDGVFNAKTAGGNHTYPTFMLNPQYRLRIHPPNSASSSSTSSPGRSVSTPKAAVTCSVQGSRTLPLHVALFWSEGSQIFDVVEKDIVAHSGPYTHGVASCTRDLPVGTYTLVVSAFEPLILGRFALDIESSARFDLEPLPAEGGGMYSRTLTGFWDELNAMGGPSFQRYFSNPTCKIVVSEPTQLRLRLQLTQPFTNAPLNVSLFKSGSNGLADQHPGQPVLTSGEYTDVTSGAVTPQVLLPAGSYDAVLSTHRPNVTSDFRLIVYGDKPFEAELHG